MKRSLALLAAAVALVLLVVAAPAVSLHPYRPAPVDFELAAPAATTSASSARAAGGVVSPVLRAPRRFNVVGLRWSGRVEPSVAMRVKRDGGRWSRWASVPAFADHGPEPASGEGQSGSGSDPVWAGEADLVQYRLSRPVPGLRLHFVNTRGTATPADRARTAVRSAASKAALAVARLGVADAAPARPAIMTRDQWGAKDCAPRGGPSYGQVKAAFVHHTVTLNDYAREDVPAIVLGVCRFHRNSRGWSDIGYNFLVDRFGTLWEGRAGGVDRAVVGAQAAGYNSNTTGISNIGDHSDLPQSVEALDAIARLIRWKLPLHGSPTSGTTTVTSAGGGSNRYKAGTPVTLNRVSGHRDGNSTACPGDALYAQLPELRRRVGSVAPAPESGAGNGTVISATLGPAAVTFPGQVMLGGQLRAADGQPVEGATLFVQKLTSRGGWKTLQPVSSVTGGEFAASLTLKRGAVLRVQFKGSEGLLPSVSRQFLVKVSPQLALQRSAAKVRVGRAFELAGSVAPSKAKLALVVERKIGRRYVRLFALGARARRGAFTTGFRPRVSGLYRLTARFAGDRFNSPGASSPVFVRAQSGAGGGAPASR